MQACRHNNVALAENFVVVAFAWQVAPLDYLRFEPVATSRKYFFQLKEELDDWSCN